MPYFTFYAKYDNVIPIYPECKTKKRKEKMKSLKTVNYADAAGIEMEQNGNKFTIKPVVGLGEASKCAVHFVEVAPGNSSFGFHCTRRTKRCFT